MPWRRFFQNRLELSKSFDIIRIMETLNAAELLAALGHESRLGIFRLLIEAGPKGMHASAIGEQLAMAPATLSFHLKELVHSGLVSQERQGRNLVYRAAYAQMNDLLGFLTQNCCQGQACLTESTTLSCDC